MANKKVKKEEEKKEIKKNTKKVKLNDKYISDEAKEVRRFVIILLSIIIIILIVYGVSKIFVDDTTTSSEKTITAGAIDYDVLSIGTILNRNHSEYYVMIYDAEDTSAILYSAVISNYMALDDAIKIYFCDLGNYFNTSYYVGSDGESNPDATSVDELALGDLTLIKVKNGKITKYIENIDDIKTELGV